MYRLCSISGIWILHLADYTYGNAVKEACDKLNKIWLGG